MAYEWHKMAVSCVSELDLQNSVDNCIDSRNQTKLFQDVMFAWLFAALVGKNVAACCSDCSSHCAKFRLVISLVFRGFSQSGHNVCSDHDCDVHGRRVTGEMKLSWVWVLYWFARKLTSSNPSMPCRWIPFGLDYVYLHCQIVTILQSQCRKQLTREISNGVGKKNCCTCQQFVCVFECRWQILRIYTYMRGNRFNWYIKPYYWVDDHPLLYGNNGSLDPSTYMFGHSLISYIGQARRVRLHVLSMGVVTRSAGLGLVGFL